MQNLGKKEISTSVCIYGITEQNQRMVKAGRDLRDLSGPTAAQAQANAGPRCLRSWPLMSQISKDGDPTTVLSVCSSVKHHHCEEFFFLRFNWNFLYYNTCPFTEHVWEKSWSIFTMITHQVAEDGTSFPSASSRKNKLSSRSLFLHTVYASTQIFKFCNFKAPQELAEFISRK